MFKATLKTMRMRKKHLLDGGKDESLKILKKHRERTIFQQRSFDVVSFQCTLKSKTFGQSNTNQTFGQNFVRKFISSKFGDVRKFFSSESFKFNNCSWVPNTRGGLNKRGGGGNPSKKLINGGGIRNSQKMGFYVIKKNSFFNCF